jgi:hypothetical protein
MTETRSAPERQRLQLHLVLPYKHEARSHHKVREFLDRGYRIQDLQRVTDREVVVTFEKALSPPG